MFDRHQAEITAMQFRGHSLPVRQSMSVPWEFTLSHFISQIRPRDLFRLLGHWNVSLPSGASLWNGMFGRVEGQNTTKSFVCTQFKCQTVLSGATTSSKSGPWSNDNEGVLYIFQNSSITWASSQDYFVSYLGHSLVGLIPLQRCSRCILQLPPPPADLANITLLQSFFSWRIEYSDCIPCRGSLSYDTKLHLMARFQF